jgi:hypothetical protein
MQIILVTLKIVVLLHVGPKSCARASRQQSCTSLFTTEAEFVFAFPRPRSFKEAFWLICLLNEIQETERVQIPTYVTIRVPLGLCATLNSIKNKANRRKIPFLS